MGIGQLTNLLKLDTSARGKNINRQIVFSFLAKGLGVCISLVQVPLLLRHLGKESYGIWLTLLSIVSWLTIMDIGIGNGLRNKLSEALAINNLDVAKKIVSTAYVSLASIMLGLLIVSIIIIPFINWQLFFNTSNQISNSSLVTTLLVMVCSTVIGFVLSLVNQVLNAIQKNALGTIPNILFGTVFIIILFSLTKYQNLDLTTIAYLYSGSYLLSYIYFSVHIFKKWAYLSPSIKEYNKSYVKDILSIGLNFFVIQIAGIIIFSTDNFIITKLFGPESVSSFNITFRVFSFISMLLTLVMAPLWSAYTEAYSKREYLWIKNRLRVMNLAMIPLIIVLILIIYYYDNIILLWLGDNVKTTRFLPAFMALYVLISVWNNIYSYFLNGISKTREQLITSILAMIINIPLSILLADYCKMGLNGIVAASIISLFLFAIVGPITTYKTLRAHE